MVTVNNLSNLTLVVWGRGSHLIINAAKPGLHLLHLYL